MGGMLANTVPELLLELVTRLSIRNMLFMSKVS